MPGLLSIERRDEVALVTLRRPEKRNALSIDLRVELADAFGGLERRRGRRLHRAHRRRERVLLGDGHEPVRRRPREPRAAGRDEHARLRGGRRLPAPGRRRGQRAGARRRLRAGAALRPAGRRRPRPRFGYPELPRGIPPSYAAARAVLPATVAQELCLTGRVVSATEARGSGSCARSPTATSSPARWSSPSGSPRCRGRRCSRPSAGRCSSASHLWGFLFEEERARLPPRPARRGRPSRPHEAAR